MFTSILWELDMLYVSSTLMLFSLSEPVSNVHLWIPNDECDKRCFHSVKLCSVWLCPHVNGGVSREPATYISWQINVCHTWWPLDCTFSSSVWALDEGSSCLHVMFLILPDMQDIVVQALIGGFWVSGDSFVYWCFKNLVLPVSCPIVLFLSVATVCVLYTYSMPYMHTVHKYTV